MIILKTVLKIESWVLSLRVDFTYLADVTTWLLNLLTKGREQLLWTETGTLTNAYDSITKLNFIGCWTGYYWRHPGTSTSIRWMHVSWPDHRQWHQTFCYTVKTNPKPWRFYILPTIHKQGSLSLRTHETNLWLTPSAKQRRNPCSGFPAVYPDLSTRHDWPVQKGLCFVCRSRLVRDNQVKGKFETHFR